MYFSFSFSAALSLSTKAVSPTEITIFLAGISIVIPLREVSMSLVNSHCLSPILTMVILVYREVDGLFFHTNRVT